MGSLKQLDLSNLPQILAALVLALALNAIVMVAKIFLESYKEKNKKTDEGIKILEKKITDNAVETLDKKIERFSSLLGSYMETTIRLTDKMEHTEKRLDQLMAMDAKLRKINSAIKLIAGPDWPRIKKEITDDEFT